jgi:hypothetical protein
MTYTNRDGKRDELSLKHSREEERDELSLKHSREEERDELTAGDSSAAHKLPGTPAADDDSPLGDTDQHSDA